MTTIELNTGIPEDIELPKTCFIPEELTDEPPRSIPESVDQSRNALGQRRLGYTLLFVGVICILLAPLPFVKVIALYFLPLEYLFYIGAGFGALGLYQIFSKPHGGNLKYIRDGVFIPASVSDMTLAPTVVNQGVPTHYAFHAAVILKHPDTDKLVSMIATSRNLSSDDRLKYRPPFQIGDIVPGVFFPHKFEKSFRLYDFLELTPDHQLVQIDGVKPSNTLEALGAVAVLGIMFFVLFWNIFALGRYSTIDEYSWQREGVMMGIGGVLIGIPGLILAWRHTKSERKKTEERNQNNAELGLPIEATSKQNRIGAAFTTLILIFGAILLGGMTIVCAGYSLNALLDNKPGERKPVEIEEMIMVTHNFIFREYKLIYRFPGDNEKHELMTTPQHLAGFFGDQGEAEIGEGYFGWKWIKTIDPVIDEETLKEMLKGMQFDQLPDDQQDQAEPEGK